RCSIRRPLLVSITRATSLTPPYTLSLHDALPIWRESVLCFLSPITIRWEKKESAKWLLSVPRHSSGRRDRWSCCAWVIHSSSDADRKSTRLNSSHVSMSYAVFCLKKKKKRGTL